ncbi:MAG: N-acetylglucosamine-6-phosphate deacetylase [Terriglobia bacterium]
MAITAIVAGTIYTPVKEIKYGVILMDGHRIVDVGPEHSFKIPAAASVIDHKNRIVTPGFIDLHTHGAAGHDFMEATPAALSAIGAFFARHGTTSYVATTVTASVEETLRAAAGLGEIVRAARSADHGTKAGEEPTAQPLGIYFEGPFLNVVRRGAHPAAEIKKPSAQMCKEFLDATGGTAVALALAPELDDELAVLKYARERGIRVGIGHSNATFEEAERAIDAGATHAVHIYNAMRPFGHRDSGIIGAVLTDDRLSAELICDGLHVEAPAVRLLLRAKGLDRVILVTDSLSATGMPDGTYQLGQFNINVVGGVCRTAEGNLAGSSITLQQALRNLVKFTGQSFKDCLPCATLNPARLLGLEKQKGVIAAGADADLAILDGDYIVKGSYVRGRSVTPSA